MIECKRPWMIGHEDCEDAWDAYGYWEAWVCKHLPEYCQAEWDECDGTLQAKLYAIMADLADGKPCQ